MNRDPERWRKQFKEGGLRLLTFGAEDRVSDVRNCVRISYDNLKQMFALGIRIFCLDNEEDLTENYLPDAEKKGYADVGNCDGFVIRDDDDFEAWVRLKFL